eukprot:183574_1
MLIVTILYLVSICLARPIYTCPNGYKACIQVKNSCPFDLWLQRTDIDTKNVTALPKTSSITLDVSYWITHHANRMYAWWENPITNQGISSTQYADKIELNINNNNGIQFLYNPTAVDYFGLPVKIGPLDNSKCTNVGMTGSWMSLTALKSNCPTAFKPYGIHGICEQPGGYCHENPSAELCSALDSTAKQCVNDGNCASDVTGVDVYSCTNLGPQWCSALFRGMYEIVKNGGNQNDPCKFYQNGIPYASYGKYVHNGCQYAEYSFPYDDDQGNGTSGYRACVTPGLYVEWCPSG